MVVVKRQGYFDVETAASFTRSSADRLSDVDIPRRPFSNKSNLYT